MIINHSSLSRLEKVDDEVKGGGILTVVLDDNTGGVDDLAGVAILIKLVQASPLTKLGTGRDLEQVDVVLGGEGSDELHVAILFAVAGEDDEVSLLAIESLGALTKTTGNTIVDDGVLEDDLDRLDDVGHGVSPIKIHCISET